MTRDVVSLCPDASVVDAVHTLERHAISGAPVVDEGGRLLGVVSYKDLARALDPTEHADGADFYLRWPAATATYNRIVGSDRYTVGDLIERDPITVDASAPLDGVARAMLAHRVHRVIVTEDERLAGVISALDFVRLYAGEASLGGAATGAPDAGGAPPATSGRSVDTP